MEIKFILVKFGFMKEWRGRGVCGEIGVFVGFLELG